MANIFSHLARGHGAYIKQLHIKPSVILIINLCMLIGFLGISMIMFLVAALPNIVADNSHIAATAGDVKGTCQIDKIIDINQSKNYPYFEYEIILQFVLPGFCPDSLFVQGLPFNYELGFNTTDLYECIFAYDINCGNKYSVAIYPMFNWNQSTYTILYMVLGYAATSIVIPILIYIIFIIVYLIKNRRAVVAPEEGIRLNDVE